MLGLPDDDVINKAGGIFQRELILFGDVRREVEPPKTSTRWVFEKSLESWTLISIVLAFVGR